MTVTDWNRCGFLDLQAQRAKGREGGGRACHTQAVLFAFSMAKIAHIGYEHEFRWDGRKDGTCCRVS